MDNYYHSTRISYQYIPFCEELYKDLRKEGSLVEDKPQWSSNSPEEPAQGERSHLTPESDHLKQGRKKIRAV